MSVLLTGASGFLGKEICSTLSSFDIITLGRDASSTIICDLSKEIPTLLYADLVIHVAGKAHLVPKTESEKRDFFFVNVEGTSNLLKALDNNAHLPKSFIFISSVAVYGLETGNGITEDYPLNATDAYGLSKIKAEKLVLDWCCKNGVICTILRLPLLAGPNPPGNLCAMIKGIARGYYFNIAGGKAKKSIVMVEDVAKIIPKVAEIGGIYNLTDGRHPSFFELSDKIAQQLGKRRPLSIPFWFAKTMAAMGNIIGSKSPINSNKLLKITSDLTFDDSLARQKLGWNPGAVLENFKINE